MRKIHNEAGYVEIQTPMMLNRQLWERSGHWDHYKENMYTTKIDDVDFAVKPNELPWWYACLYARASFIP